ncbi:MAG: ParA family protein [Calditrichaeota bacterium]|nr:ParA family protein [Calditrichota bacterium]MCB0294235.1 ParA family protein [Calditrichota bacterium]MCB0303724.1 ParA family protein [Calditrichota bacterium]MCB9089067.1 ParA family protein [Calditrichia bacterium]
MGQTVSFIIQKGGCGKTTATANTASYLALQGYRVLAIDMDPQGNLTQHFGYDTDNLAYSLVHLFTEKNSFEEVVLKRDEHLHILPNNIEMTSVEFSLYKSFSREYILRDVLAPVSNEYDFILIDCPPNLGILSVNALVASTEFILVVSPEFFPMRAIKPLYETYLMVKSKLNRTLKFKGVVMSMCDFRTRHAQEVRKILEKNFPHKLYKSYIRNSVSLKEASSHGKSIFEYDAASTGAFDYQNFVEEFLRDHAGARQKKAFYEAHFHQLPAHEQEEIIQFAMQNLSNYNRSRLDYLEEEPILREALLIERNKILEKLFPYREHSTANQRP